MLEANLPSHGETLRAFRLSPEGFASARLAILHGYGEHGGRYLPFMQWIADRGIASASFDFRGQGRSTGRRAYVRQWDDFLRDAETFLAWEAATAPSKVPLFILGHSHGALVLVAGVIRERFRAEGFILTSPFLRNKIVVSRSKRLLAMIADPIVPWLRVRTGLQDTMMTSDQAMRSEARSDPLMVRVATPRWFSTMRKAQDEVMGRAAEFTASVLCLTGTSDPIADSDAAADFICRSASLDKTLHPYPNLRHELLRETNRHEIFEEILRWIIARTPTATQALPI